MESNIQPLDKVFLHLGPLSIKWYGVLIGLGVVLGLWLAIRESKRRGIPDDTFLDLILVALPSAIIGARIYYVLFEWSYYSKHVSEIPAIWHGGLAIHGGLIGAFIASYFFAKKRGISFWKLADIAAPSILVGQMLGRWGNFMNQEAHGGPVTRSFLESLHLPTWIINQMYIDGTYYHPTFLYESLWSLLGIIFLLILRRVNLRRGEMFLTYLIWYSVGRFFIEGLRTDSLMLTSTIRMAQFISVVIIILSIFILVYRRVKGLSNERYLDA
jgi:phosphatidylglycerol:prolipoprotein diacylglycerol transferase